MNYFVVASIPMALFLSSLPAAGSDGQFVDKELLQSNHFQPVTYHYQKTIQLPEGFRPVNEEFSVDYSACMHWDLEGGWRDPACAAEFDQVGFQFITTIYDYGGAAGPIARASDTGDVFQVVDSSLTYDATTNTVTFDITYDLAAGCGTSRCKYNPVAKAGLFINGVGGQPTFDAASRSISFSLESTDWADLHYSVDGGPLQNVRMVKNGDTFSYPFAEVLENGSTIDFSTTSQPTGSGAVDSEWTTLTVSGLRELLDTTFSSGAFHLGSARPLQWVDIHYSINGGNLRNHRMVGADTTFVHEVPVALASGDEMTYWYTYSIDGRATDTDAKSVVAK